MQGVIAALSSDLDESEIPKVAYYGLETGRLDAYLAGFTQVCTCCPYTRVCRSLPERKGYVFYGERFSPATRGQGLEPQDGLVVGRRSQEAISAQSPLFPMEIWNCSPRQGEGSHAAFHHGGASGGVPAAGMGVPPVQIPPPRPWRASAAPNPDHCWPKPWCRCCSKKVCGICSARYKCLFIWCVRGGPKMFSVVDRIQIVKHDGEEFIFGEPTFPFCGIRCGRVDVVRPPPPFLGTSNGHNPVGVYITRSCPPWRGAPSAGASRSEIRGQTNVLQGPKWFGNHHQTQMVLCSV